MVVTRKEMMFGIGQLCSITKFLQDFSLEEPDLTRLRRKLPYNIPFQIMEEPNQF
jgi:hypothetical protein